MQLERTGQEYLVVRRYQNPIGAAIKRLERLPGAEKYVRIPYRPKHRSRLSSDSHGLSSSLRDHRSNGVHDGKISTGARSSYDDRLSQNSSDLSGRANTDDSGVGETLRSIWEKSFELSASQE